MKKVKRKISTLFLLFVILTIYMHGQNLYLLGTLGGNNSEAFDVSSNGIVVGRSTTEGSGQYRAFRWTQSSGMQDLGTLGGSSAEAKAISADGIVVVGFSSDENFSVRAFRWTETTEMQIIDNESWSRTEAVSISDNGVIAGTGRTLTFEEHAFIWNETIGIQDLGTAPDASNSKAIDISGDGAVLAIESGTADIWTSPGNWTSMSGASNMNTSAISSTGEFFVGYAWGGSNSYFAFWSDGTGIKTFVVPGSISGYANDVNEDGSIIVGSATFYPNISRAYRWTSDSGFEDLNEVYASLTGDSVTLMVATAISPNGRYITGYAHINGEMYRPYMLDTWNANSLEQPRKENANSFRLAQNFPNPFNPTTTVQYTIPEQSYVKLVIYDLLGRELKTLINEIKQPGQHHIRIDMTGHSGGVYFYRLESKNNLKVRKMVFLK